MERAIRYAEREFTCALQLSLEDAWNDTFCELFCTNAKRNGLFSYLRKVLGYTEHGPNFYKDSYLLLKTKAN